MESLRRALGKSPAYLMRRSMQEARRFAGRGLLGRRLLRLTREDVAAKLGYPSLSAFWASLIKKGFLYADRERSELRGLYESVFRESRSALQVRLGRILAHEFDLLGSGTMQLGEEINWHRDFKSGRIFDIAPSKSIDYAELDRPSDVKVPWELSRGHQFVTLGQAWLVERDERALKEFESQILSWIQSNPVGTGINWSCTMEVGIRAVNWLWALALFADAPLENETCETVLHSLFKHGMWIPENLEVAQINGNHYIADALGLVACGALFRDSPEGRSWLDLGSKILEQEIMLQVDDEGVDIEASIAYHRLVLEIFLTGARLLEWVGRTPSDNYRSKLESMFHFVAAYTPAYGLCPVVGDADDGRVLQFSDIPLQDHRYLLSIGGALFQHPGWRESAGKLWEDSLWFLGPSKFADYVNPTGAPARDESQPFSVSGFYILRPPGQYLFVDAGPVGFKGLGGHGHNDCLSFEWHVAGKPIITDSGLYVYTASAEWRNKFRSTEYHNTIRVDGEEINHFLSPPTLWFLGNDAQPIEVRYFHDDQKEVLRAGHTGYRRLADPVTTMRAFELDRRAPILRLSDRMEGDSEHLIELFFHAAPGSKLQFESARKVSFYWPDGVTLQLEQTDGPPAAFTGKEGWFAPSYGVKVARAVCVASVRVKLPVEFVWQLTVLPTSER